jgi:cytosine permease
MADGTAPVAVQRDLAYVVEDHALNTVPAEERKSGWSLSWMTMGIVTTLVQILIAGYVTAVAGVGLGVLAGLLVAAFGAALGWLVGHVSHLEGVSSTVTGRFYGFGVRGSAIASAIYGFMILGFLALENALLYYGTLFTFGWQDSLAHRLLVYGVLTVIWIVLTTFGVNLVLRVSSVTLIAFLALMGFMVWKAGWDAGVPIQTTLTHGALLPGLGDPLTRFQTVIVALAGSAGALALVDADYARYARSSRDVGIMCVAGAVMIDIVIVIAGTIMVFGGTPLVAAYLVQHHAATPATAAAAASALAQANTGAFFIVLSTVAGFAMMYLAQAKAQVLNTYSGSLALTNLFDVLFGLRLGRFAMVIVGNLVGLAMVAGGILNLIQSWLDALGIFTTAFCAVMIADHYLVRRRTRADREAVEEVNWAGVVSVVGGSIVAMLLEHVRLFQLGFVAVLVLVLIFYPVLRTTILRPGTLTRPVSHKLALAE